MRLSRRFALASVVILLSGPSLQGQAPSILEPKAPRYQGPPLWISAEAVADEQRIINLDLLDSPFLNAEVDRQRRDLAERVPSRQSTPEGKPTVSKVSASECKSTSLQMDGRGGDGPSATLEDLLIHSKSIIHGTVRSIDRGFSFGSPSSLIGVDSLEVVKGPAPASPFYIDYPIAAFRIGPYYFCAGNKGFEPRLGDELLLFDYTGPGDRDDLLYFPRLDQIFFQSQSGTLFVPSPLKSTPQLKTLHSLAEIITSLRSGTPGGVR